MFHPRIHVKTLLGQLKLQSVPHIALVQRIYNLPKQKVCFLWSRPNGRRIKGVEVWDLRKNACEYTHTFDREYSHSEQINDDQIILFYSGSANDAQENPALNNEAANINNQNQNKKSEIALFDLKQRRMLSSLDLSKDILNKNPNDFSLICFSETQSIYLISQMIDQTSSITSPLTGLKKNSSGKKPKEGGLINFFKSLFPSSQQQVPQASQAEIEIENAGAQEEEENNHELMDEFNEEFQCSQEEIETQCQSAKIGSERTYNVSYNVLNFNVISGQIYLTKRSPRAIFYQTMGLGGRKPFRINNRGTIAIINDAPTQELNTKNNKGQVVHLYDVMKGATVLQIQVAAPGKKMALRILSIQEIYPDTYLVFGFNKTALFAAYVNSQSPASTNVTTTPSLFQTKTLSIADSNIKNTIVSLFPQEQHHNQQNWGIIELGLRRSEGKYYYILEYTSKYTSYKLYELSLISWQNRLIEEWTDIFSIFFDRHLSYILRAELDPFVMQMNDEAPHDHSKVNWKLALFVRSLHDVKIFTLYAMIKQAKLKQKYSKYSIKQIFNMLFYRKEAIHFHETI